MNGRMIRSLAVLASTAFFVGCGGGGIGETELDSTPTTAFEGGGGQLSVSFDSNQPAVLHTTFGKYDEASGHEEYIDSAEEFDAGSHVRTIDVSPSTYIYLELGLPDATPGAEVSWTVSVDGQQIVSERETLDEPLGSDYAFFLQVEADDLVQLRSYR